MLPSPRTARRGRERLPRGRIWTSPTTEDGASLIGSYLSILRRRALVILAVASVVAPLAFIALARGGPTYESESFLLVATPNVAEGIVGQPQPYEDPERRVATEIEVIEGQAVGTRAVDRLREQGVDADLEEVTEQVEAVPRGFSSAVAVVGTATDARRAQQITAAVVDSYVAYRSALQQNQLEQLAERLQRRVSNAEDELTAAAQTGQDEDAPGDGSAARDAALGRYDRVAGWLEEVRVRQSVDSSGVQVISPASTPAEPLAAMPAVVAGLLAMIGGLLFGCGIALVVDLFRDAVRTAKEAETLTSAPILAELPRPRGDRSALVHAVNDPTNPVAAAGRGLRLRLDTLSDGALPETMVLVGAREDATDVFCAGVTLAASCGRVNLKVALVADPVPDVALPTPRPAVSNGQVATAGPAPEGLPTALPGVWLAPATTRADGLPGLFDAFEPKAALAALGNDFHVVVVVVPPTSEVVEAVALGRLCDAVVVVPVLDRTPGRTLERLVTTLEKGGVPIEGLALSRTYRARRTRGGQLRRPIRSSRSNEMVRR